jgi:hypothetical protein
MTTQDDPTAEPATDDGTKKPAQTDPGLSSCPKGPATGPEQAHENAENEPPA